MAHGEARDPGGDRMTIAAPSCPACGQPLLVENDHLYNCMKTLALKKRGFQIMARRMAEGVGLYDLLGMIGKGSYERAGGDVDCATCRLPYVEHPEIPGFPTFHVLCNHSIVKI
jgi:hypothetical protein